MKTAHTNMKEAQAVAKIDLGRKSADMVGKARNTVNAVKANPDFATKPEVQQSTGALTASTDALDNNMKALAAARTEVRSLLTSHIVLTAALKRSAKSLVAVISDTAGGSADGIKKWGLDVAGRQPTIPTATAPDGLRATYTRDFTLAFRWNGVRGAKGYELEIGDGTAQGWGPSIHLNRARYEPSGLAPGQHVSVRVAVHRASGLSVYSDPLVVTVR